MQRVGTISELKRRNTQRTLYWKELLSHALNRMSINGDLKRTQMPHEGRRGKIAMYEWAKK